MCSLSLKITYWMIDVYSTVSAYVYLSRGTVCVWNSVAYKFTVAFTPQSISRGYCGSSLSETIVVMETTMIIIVTTAMMEWLLQFKAPSRDNQLIVHLREATSSLELTRRQWCCSSSQLWWGRHSCLLERPSFCVCLCVRERERERRKKRRNSINQLTRYNLLCVCRDEEKGENIVAGSMAPVSVSVCGRVCRCGWWKLKKVLLKQREKVAKYSKLHPTGDTQSERERERR